MNKRKIMLMALTVMMVAILAVGGSLAYLIDTDTQMNTFTTGKVGINLDEAIVVPDANDNLVDSGKRTENEQNYELHPGITVCKDPTITVDDGSEDAYLGAIVVVKGDLYDLIGVSGYDTIDITKFASGGLMVDGSGSYSSSKHGLTVFTSTEYTIYQQADKVNNTWTLYVVVTDTKSENEEVVIFDTLKIPADYENEQMEKLEGMTIQVTAYAAQVDGFDSAKDALMAAFNEWKIIE